LGIPARVDYVIHILPGCSGGFSEQTARAALRGGSARPGVGGEWWDDPLQLQRGSPWAHPTCRRCGRGCARRARQHRVRSTIMFGHV